MIGMWKLALAGLTLACLVAKVAAAEAAPPEWTVQTAPDQLPWELMPRRYVDYPIAYALFQLTGVAAVCGEAVPEVKSAAEALSQALLEAADYTLDERVSTMAMFRAQFRDAPAITDAGWCHAELTKAETPAREFIASRRP